MKSNESIVLPRPVAKRAAALALINSLSNVCQIYSPYLYPSKCRFISPFQSGLSHYCLDLIRSLAN